ncbi:MAG: PilT/PilU family type 4a pilus ATPase [bacterium]
MNFKILLENAYNEKISDIHLKVGTPPIFKKDGKLTPLELPPVTLEEMNNILSQILSDAQSKTFESTKELDFAIASEKMGRFRVNLYREKGTPALAMRFVPQIIKGLEELNVPTILKEWSLKPRGLILCTGTVGSGKSTTIAAMLEYINQNAARNIITVEDPIEFIFEEKKSIISQREVGIDTLSFATALKQIFRQDPDVIFVGEMRDVETVDISLKAADTGHLVVSTLHTMNAMETINRIISFFPPHQHQHIRILLAASLVGVMSLRLLPKADGQGRVPACEVMVATDLIKEYIIDQTKTKFIQGAIEDGKMYYSMLSFDASVMALYKQGSISLETAMRAATNPADFELKLKGIQGRSY